MTSAFENGLYGGLLLSIIAFSVVFIVLGGLTLLIVAIKFVGSSDKGSGKKGEVVYSGGEGASSETSSAPVTQAVSTEWPTATEPQAIGGIEEEEIAAISAAIAAYSSAPFEIKSVRMVIPPRTGLWRKASFLESLEGIE